MRYLQNPRDAYGSAINNLTNPNTVLLEYEMTLRSQYEKDGNVVSFGKPLMNEEGISSVMGQIRTMVNQNNILSNLTDERKVEKFSLNFSDTLIADFLMNSYRYGLKNAQDRRKIVNSASNLVYMCLMRAYKEGDKRFWKGSVQEFKQEINAPARKGILSSLIP